MRPNANYIGARRKITAAELAAGFGSRVAADSGVYEASSCLTSQLQSLDTLGFLDRTSFLLTPNGYKEDKLYSIYPASGAGDFTFTRTTTATRQGPSVIEPVPYNLLQRSEEFDNVVWNKVNTTVTPNTVADYLGVLAADTLADNVTAGNHYISYPGQPGSSGTYIISIIAKANTLSYLNLHFENTPFTGNIDAVFDLTNGVCLSPTIGTGWSGGSSTIESLGNGWYKCTLTATQANSATTTITPLFALRTTYANGLQSYSGSGQSIFISKAQFTKTSETKSYFKTTDRLDVPRLDYPIHRNLLTRSQEFDSDSWIKTNTTASSNVTTAPDGTLTADKFIPDATLGQHRTFQSVITNGITTTFSVYAKAAEYSYLSLAFSGGLSGQNIIFDVTNGTISGSDGAVINRKISSEGNGWYRCSITFTGALVSTGHFIIVRNANSTTDYSGDGTSGIYLWGAQLQTGNVATTYIPTTTTVVDAVGCPSILLEPARTNLVVRSEEFDNASWVKSNVTSTANQDIAPDGINTSDLITTTVAGNNAISQTITVTASTVYTASWWIKKGTITTTSYRVRDVTGAVDIIAKTGYTTSSSSYTKFTVTFTTPVGCVSVQIFPNLDSEIGTYYLWGAQLEQGSYATSYIPTTSATVTRNADTVNALTGVSSLIGQTEGTLYLNHVLTDTGTERHISLSDGTGNNRILIIVNATRTIRCYVQTGGVIQVDFTTVSAYSAETTVKVAITYQNNKVALFVNGTKINEDLSATIPATSVIRFDSSVGGLPFYGKVNTLTLSKTALTDAEAIALTTL